MSARDTADGCWRRLVKARAGERCERCDVGAFHAIGGLDAAHIIPRGFGLLRCDLTNGRALCRRCHAAQEAHRWSWPELIGGAEYVRLRTLANAPWKRPAGWWETERDRLRQIEARRAA